MSYIIKTANALINAKLTDIGRKKLAGGQLNFKQWAFGDSEIDYSSLGTSVDFSTLDILRPKDNNPDLKYRIPKSGTTSLNTLPQITPVELTITNTAKTRGFFTGDTTAGFTAFTSSEYAHTTCTFDVSSLTGGTCLTVAGGTFSSSNVGDLIMLKMSNPYVTTTTASGVVEEDAPVPYLMYEIESVTTGGATDYICLDRELPNFGGAAGTVDGFGIVYPGGDSIQNFYGSGSTTPYWNEDTLAFDSNCDLGIADVDVWNMNITNSLPVAGVDPATYEDFTKYGSTGYTGSKLYFDLTYNDNAGRFYTGGSYQPAAGLVHYTNNTIANFYGEQLYVSSANNSKPTLQLPTIMDYRNSGSTVGLSLVSGTVEKVMASGGTENVSHHLTYYDLIAQGQNGDRVVGCVMADQKMFVISDMEINSVMSYKANRNWTLPTPDIDAIQNSNGVIDQGESMYVSYIFSTTSGYTAGIHCQNYAFIENQTGSLDDVRVTFTTDLDYLKPGLSGSAGIGFEAHGLHLIFQKVLNGSQPSPDAWKIYDFTSSVSGSTAGPIDKNDIYGIPLVIDNDVYTGATTYNLNDYITIPTTAEPDKLQFGDERFFYGNIETQIAATAYKSAFNFIADNGMFTTSNNPTFNGSFNQVYISEVGVYDSDGDLVVIGKLSSPIKKDNSKTVIVQLEIDF
tara:strand:+ start:5162 stop:7201 length:2040 start_codon:yes stop_codon:yes gene_type:complete